ncbi:MAG: hypothetical protein IIC78_13100, partial [Chloroflexi bacterium]|nr:hypothetical protein [Chloroflexota bacterium]
ANDYTIAFWVNATNAEFSIRGTGTDHFPFDFEPYQPTSNWPVDSVSVAYQTIAYDGSMLSLTIGFYRIASGKADFISIDGADKELLTVPLSGR